MINPYDIRHKSAKQAKIPTESVRLCASESLKHTLDDYRAGYLTVGSFGYYQRIFRLDDIVGDYQSSTHREAMEELAVVGPSHVLCIHCP